MQHVNVQTFSECVVNIYVTHKFSYEPQSTFTEFSGKWTKVFVPEILLV